jgi:GNAT superfamily N-acetyltransferase
MLRIHPAARKHGIADADIEHAVKYAIAIDDLGDWKRLYLGPGRNAALLEVVALVQGQKSQMIIHAMKMRSKYRKIILGGR